MIVECKNCSTRFQLDDTRVPPAGIRVRCSRCKQAFFLEHPDADTQDRVEAAAAEAVRQAEGHAPEPATDLAGTSLDDLEKFKASGVLDEDEDDWEFNHDPAPGDGAPAPDAEPAPRFDAEAPSGLELDGDAAAPEPESEPDPAPAAGAESEMASPEDGGSFGTVDDFGSLGEAEEVAEEVESEAAASASPLENDIAGVIDSLDDLSIEAADDASERVVAEDLGEPEEWDLLGSDAPSDFAQVDAGEPSHMRSSVEAPEPAPARRSRASRSPRPVSGGMGAAALVGRAVGWLAFAALFAGAVAQGLTAPVGASDEARRYDVGTLVADDVATRWITVGGGETLLAVSGVLSDPSSSERVVGALVAIDLLDATGRPLDLPAAHAGRPLDPRALRTLPPAERAAQMETAARRLAYERVPAGEVIPFEAYFESVPADALRVSVRSEEIRQGSFDAPWREPEATVSGSGDGDATGAPDASGVAPVAAVGGGAATSPTSRP